MKTKTMLNILLLAVTGLFCISMANLFSLRFQSGDIYPEYSSLRSDPLGTSALFESMQDLGQDLDDIHVQRNYLPPRRIKDLENTCLFFLGIETGKQHFVSRKEYEQIIQMAEAGGRLIIALKPVDLHTFKHASLSKNRAGATGSDTQDTQDTQAVKKSVDLFKQLNISLEYDHLTQGQYQTQPGDTIRTNENFKPVSWPFALWFTTDPSEWKALAFVKHKPVIIEKPFKQGSLVFTADTYMFSNESLQKNNVSQLLSVICADKKNIIFDEYHLGIHKQPGISTLIKKYNLYGVFLLIGLFIAVFIWKNSYSLLPVDESKEIQDMLESDQGQMQSKDNLSGLVNLLRQHIPASELISECKSAWKNTFVKNNKSSKKYQALFNRIESETRIGNKKKHRVDTYKQITRILSEKEKNEQIH